MKRTPLARRKPLRDRGRRQPAWTPPEPTPLDLDAAAVALKRREEASAPREFTGPVPEVSKRTPKPSRTGFPPVVRQTIIDRDRETCQRCGCSIDGPEGYSLQHRDNRGSGGTSDPRINRPSNGLTLCGSGTTGCHGWVEHHPHLAARLGYVVESWADATTVPVYSPFGWVLLDDNGNAHPTAPPPGGDAHAVARRKEKLR